jgi:hypothetical protein
MNYVEFEVPVKKELSSKLSGRAEFELFAGLYEDGKPMVYMARCEKNNMTVYDEFTPEEVGNLS